MLPSIPGARLSRAFPRVDFFSKASVAITHHDTAISLNVTKWGDVPIARRAAMHGDSVQLVTSSLTAERDGTRSQIILIATRIGTDNKAPGTPHSHVQKIRDTKITTGFSVKRRPSRTGVMRFASKRWSSK